MNRHLIIAVAAIMAMGLASLLQAGEQDTAHDHAQHQDEPDMEQHMRHDHGDPQSPMTGEDVFLIKKDIDGYQVSFHVMRTDEGQGHHFMVRVEKNGEIIDLAAANSKVIHPDGAEESKVLMKTGDWYTAGYDLTHEGEHQLMVLFKTADGLKHFGGVYYAMHME